MRISSINNFQYKPVYNRQTARKETAKPASMVSKPSFGGIYDDIVANKIDYMNNPQEHEVDKQLGHEIEKLTENKLKITLSLDDLQERNIDMQSFIYNSNIIQNNSVGATIGRPFTIHQQFIHIIRACNARPYSLFP